MYLICLGFGLSTFHQEDVRSQSLHFHHVIVVELLALSRVVVHPVEYNVCVVIRLEPLFSYLETLLVLHFRLSAQPMPLVLVQENLKRCDAPASLALLAKFLHVCQCGIRFDE